MKIAKICTQQKFPTIRYFYNTKLNQVLVPDPVTQHQYILNSQRQKLRELLQSVRWAQPGTDPNSPGYVRTTACNQAYLPFSKSQTQMVMSQPAEICRGERTFHIDC